MYVYKNQQLTEYPSLSLVRGKYGVFGVFAKLWLYNYPMLKYSRNIAQGVRNG